METTTEQLVFNVYCYAIVGLLGNTLIGWELGKKGWIRLGLEGPKNRRVLFAMYCFIFMILWQMVRKLDNPITSWTDFWIPAWGGTVFLISHFLVPKSMRLYNRAKFLHETTYTGNWPKQESEVPPEHIRNNWRLQKAESLYLKALETQKRLSNQSENEAQATNHERNVAVTYCQLALLYLQQKYFDKAAGMVKEGILIAEMLRDKLPNHPEILSILSDSFFRAAEIEQKQGKLESAKKNYQLSLSIDRDLKNEMSINITETRLREIAEAASVIKGTK